MSRAALGQKGEALAARYYLDRGCRLLAHNYRTRQGELDLVLAEGETVVICEVKARTGSAAYGAPAEAVSAAKQRRLIQAAAQYLQQTGRSDAPVRFDVAEVTPAPGGWQVHCIRNAFTCD